MVTAQPRPPLPRRRNLLQLDGASSSVNRQVGHLDRNGSSGSTDESQVNEVTIDSMRTDHRSLLRTVDPVGCFRPVHGNGLATCGNAGEKRGDSGRSLPDDEGIEATGDVARRDVLDVLRPEPH